MKLKSLLAETLLKEALTPLDKKAVQNFFDGKPFESKNLNSDGKTLKTVGIGSQPMYTHTPNGVKMVGKVTGGYSQSLVKYVNFIYKTDLVESITLNENINKDVKSFLDKSLKGLKAGSPPHLFAVKHTLIGALTDANFHSEAKKVPALFPKAAFEPTSYGENEEEAIHMYEYEVGPQIARIAEWDGGAIVDAIGFYVSMTIGRPVGEKITKLVESSITEAAGIEAMGIAGFTGTRGDAVQKFIDDNNLDAKKLFAYIKGGKLKERMGFVSAIAGTPGNKVQKELISKFKLKEGIKEVKYPTDLKVGSVILGQGFTSLKGIEDGKYYTVVEMDDTTATLVLSDMKGNVKGTKKVRHKLSSIEGGIKTAKRGDENGIVVI